jgi:hypothetical protein
MADLHVADRVVARAIVARVGSDIEAARSSRMYANRLVRSGSRWQLRNPGKAWLAYQGSRLASLEKHRWRYTLLTDLRGYYGSIGHERLETELRPLTRDDEAVTTLMNCLSAWQDRDGLRGLPVGDEAFGVLSAPMLIPIDAFLTRWAGDHHIYGDDMTVFHTDQASGWVLRAELENVLGERGLVLNTSKTDTHLDAVNAMIAIENDLLSSVTTTGYIDPDAALDKVYDLWDEVRTNGTIVAPRKLAEAHFALRWLARRGDAYAAASLVLRRDILMLTPRTAVDYLIKAAPTDPAIAGAMIEIAGTPITDETEALVLHALRYLSESDRDDGLGSCCTRILDGTAHGPTRAWAAAAHRRSPSWSCMEALERAEAASDFWVGRSLLASTRGSEQRPRLRGLALRAFAARQPDLAAVARWAQTAAA